ncbi:Hypothetical predicted protein [Mytilus galloprovincialis]|uniref:Uncharacterized protein n=1 Tax=Mytilus galloprovincialis TaxID=29158 RepID=A0A8B6FBD9_MYTGA|nr:Hypothetical predicted protein [Mytilus galloprovincialis]
MVKTNPDTRENIYVIPHFTSKLTTITESTDLELEIAFMVEKVKESMAKYMREGSGWTFGHIEKLEIHLNKFKPLKGSSYIALPKPLGQKKAIINVQNTDQECLRWAILSALHHEEVDNNCTKRVGQYKNLAVTKRWVTQQLKDGIEDIDELEVALTTTSKEIQALKKQLNVIEKDVAKSLPMTGGKMVGGIDMQGHSITNLPLSTTANEPVTKGWYAKNWQDLVKNLTDRVNDLEKEIKGRRSRRELDAITKEDKTLDSIKTTLENRLG